MSRLREDDGDQPPGARSATSAVILVGLQNDFFSELGALRTSLEDEMAMPLVIDATVRMLRALEDTPATLIVSPIQFSEDYAELVDPVGLFATIKEQGAFRCGSDGSAVVDELRPFATRVQTVTGRRGFDAFTNTELDDVLRGAGVTDVFVAGALSSICVDSTARAAYERGYRVSVIRDCTLGRTAFEHSFFCERIFPLYATVLDSDEVVAGLREGRPAS